MEEEYKPKNFRSAKMLLTLLSFLAFLNLLFLDLVTLRNQKATQVLEKIAPLPVAPSPKDQQPTDKLCPTTCLSQIYEATKSYKPASIPASISTSVPSVTQAPSSSFVKEFFVPFGSGTNSSEDWQDVAGLTAYVDSTNYSNIKNVTLEASVHIPTGNETAYVRIYNATDKHPVWLSEVSLEGGATILLVSKPITLNKGNKAYQVQMKTSLKYPAVLDQARLHIITY